MSIPPENPTKSRSNVLLVVVISIVACIVVFVLARPSLYRYMRAVEISKRPRYSLEVDGPNLMFEMQPNRGLPVRTVVSELPKSDISFDASFKNGVHSFTITSKKGKFTRVGPRVDEVRISSKHRTVFFREAVMLPPDSNGVVYGRYVLWQWNEKDGFKPITGQLSHINEIRLSMDENILQAKYYDDGVKPAFGLFTHPVLGGTDLYAFSSYVDSVHAVVDKGTYIVDSPSLSPTQEPQHSIQKLNVGTSKLSQLFNDPSIVQAVAFNGSVWCLCSNEGKYWAIRLNKTLDKAEERIELPLKTSPSKVGN